MGHPSGETQVAPRQERGSRHTAAHRSAFQSGSRAHRRPEAPYRSSDLLIPECPPRQTSNVREHYQCSPLSYWVRRGCDDRARIQTHGEHAAKRAWLRRERGRSPVGSRSARHERRVQPCRVSSDKKNDDAAVGRPSRHTEILKKDCGKSDITSCIKLKKPRFSGPRNNEALPPQLATAARPCGALQTANNTAMKSKGNATQKHEERACPPSWTM